jgi:hypothetical protein
MATTGAGAGAAPAERHDLLQDPGTVAPGITAIGAQRLMVDNRAGAMGSPCRTHRDAAVVGLRVGGEKPRAEPIFPWWPSDWRVRSRSSCRPCCPC